MELSKRVRLAVLCVHVIACIAIVNCEEVFSSTKQHGELLSKVLAREKRHSLKFGRCDPIETNLGQGLQFLHEMPVRKEKFFIRPRSTFSKMSLHIKLDNTFSRSAPKIYGDSVQFSYKDLKTIDYNGWIEVVAEVSKYKKSGPDYWKIRLTVGDNWVREAMIYKWAVFYAFDSLVISGEGGCEWTFDCYPDDTIDGAVHEALEFDPKDDRWWLVGALVGAAVLLVLVVVAGVWCHRRGKQPSTSGDYISKTISFRKSKQKTTCEEIYEELGSPSMNRLRDKMAAFTNEGSPPPLPAPNPPRDGSYTTVMPPQKKMVSDVKDQEWFGSLELHSTDGKMDWSKHTEVTSSTLPQVTSLNEVSRGAHNATEPRGARQNHYSDSPTAEINSNTYVDMRILKKDAPSQ